MANRKVTDAAFDVIEGLVALAEARGCTPSQLALAWVAGQPGVTAPIIGPRTEEQLVDNLGALGMELSQDERSRLDELAPPRSVTLPYWDTAMGLDLRPHLRR